jgi:hypothetical protein
MALIKLSIEGLSTLQRLRAVLSPAAFEKAKIAGVRYAAKATIPAVAKAVSSRYNIEISAGQAGHQGSILPCG